MDLLICYNRAQGVDGQLTRLNVDAELTDKTPIRNSRIQISMRNGFVTNLDHVVVRGAELGRNNVFA